MAKRKARNKKTTQASNGENGGIVSLTKELFQAAITLRGSVEPADYKRYVLPIIFLRFLSLRYDRRRAELEALWVPSGRSGNSGGMSFPFHVTPRARRGIAGIVALGGVAGRNPAKIPPEWREAKPASSNSGEART